MGGHYNITSEQQLGGGQLIVTPEGNMIPLNSCKNLWSIENNDWSDEEEETKDVDPPNCPMTMSSIGEGGDHEALKTREGIALVQVDVKEVEEDEAVKATITANVAKVEQVGNETTTTNDEHKDVKEMLFKAFLAQMADKGFDTNTIRIEIGGKQLSLGEKKIGDVGTLDEVKDDESTNKDEAKLQERTIGLHMKIKAENKWICAILEVRKKVHEDALWRNSENRKITRLSHPRNRLSRQGKQNLQNRKMNQLSHQGERHMNRLSNLVKSKMTQNTVREQQACVK
jgi:hypothetical protein